MLRPQYQQLASWPCMPHARACAINDHDQPRPSDRKSDPAKTGAAGLVLLPMHNQASIGLSNGQCEYAIAIIIDKENSYTMDIQLVYFRTQHSLDRYTQIGHLFSYAQS